MNRVADVRRRASVVLVATLTIVAALAWAAPRQASAAPPPLSGTPYWQGWSIARDLTFVPGSTTAGYVLDGWGGTHAFGGAPPLTGLPYWRGWDIARGLVLLPGGTSGYLLDGWGGVHPFGGAPPLGSGLPYWPGWDIASDLVLTGPASGYLLDGWGGTHPFGGASALGGTPYWPGWNIARGLTLPPGSTTQGWVLDGWGGLHPFGGAAGILGSPYWPGWDIARAFALPTAASGYLLDGWGGVHGFDPRTPTLTPNRTFVTGLDHPWDLAFAPDATLLYTERPNGLSASVGGVKHLVWKPADLVVASEAGMMGLALDPNFARNRYAYVCYASSLGDPSNDVRVARVAVSATYDGITGSPTPIVTGAPVNVSGQLGRHSGCRPRFGPDGKLWIGTGDAATGTVPQSPASLGGKVLRVNSDGTAPTGNMGAPFDARIYNYGHRNVQGLAFRSDGKLFTIEHGPDRNDEVNVAVAAGNYGWDPVPGYNEAVPMTDFAKFPNAVASVWASGDGGTIAPSGATFLSGSQWESWEGALAVAVLKGAELRLMFTDGPGHVTATFTVPDLGGTRLRSAVQGPDGSLYLATDVAGPSGAIWRVTPS